MTERYFLSRIFFEIRYGMADREENVYKAKLAEQAERYDGEYDGWKRCLLTLCSVLTWDALNLNL